MSNNTNSNSSNVYTSVSDTNGGSSNNIGSKKNPIKKQRILWDSDNTTRDGKTSIGILLEWLTAPSNYERWKDGKSQFGETREALCTEIKAIMKKHGILHRENANIRTQISELERSYDAAVTWLTQNGYNGRLPESKTVDTGDFQQLTSSGAEGGEDNGGNPVEAQVLRLCRYFHVLDAILRQPSANPRVRRSYTRIAKKRHDDDRQQHHISKADEEEGSFSENGVDKPVGAGGETQESVDINRRQQGVGQKRKVSSVSTSFTSSATITPSSNSSSTSATPVSTTQLPSFMQEPWQTATSLATYENTQRLIVEAAREDRELKRFRLEEERSKLEIEKLRCEVEQQKLQLVVERVLARKKLLDTGLPQAEVDALLAKE